MRTAFSRRRRFHIDIINRVKEKTGLQATAGLGDNFFLAKVALDVFAKKAKDGIGELHIEEVKEILANGTEKSRAVTKKIITDVRNIIGMY